MTKTNENKPIMSLSNCPTCGDEIKALVRYYTGSTLGRFTLEKALEEVTKNDEKIKQLKEELTK